MSSKTLRLASFDVGTDDLRWWAPEILERYPEGFYDMHRQLFDAVCQESPPEDLGGVELGGVELIKYEPRKAHYPSQEELTDLDGIVISGSASGAYDSDDWIAELCAVIRDYHDQQIPLSGFSFAPQIVAQALGGKVERNPPGTELSVVTINLSPEAQTYFGTDRPSYAIQVHHNDGIVQLPPGAVSLGTSGVTEYLGWMLGGHILVFSGHPEYSRDPWILERMMLVERKDHLVPAQLIDFGLRELWNPTDYVWQTQQQFRFFLGQFSV
ncbi:MAG: type 1 glutamine amidotransferase [Leptolyngbya sp. SIO1D8]|nr:type 1 glutamine amidotransferase [Leptolyngbya sp. SIO1D8]